MPQKLNRQVVVLDIETTPEPASLALAALAENLAPRGNLVDPAKIAKDMASKKAELLESATLSPWTSSIVAIGYCNVHDRVTECLLATHLSERNLLEDFAHIWDSWWTDGEPPLVVTFCGRKFDLPFLAARLAIHDVLCMPLPLQRPDCFKHHLDLKEDLMKDFKGGLHIAALAMLGMGKVDDVEQLQEWIKAGNWVAVREYCLNDVALTEGIYRKYERML